MIEIVPAIDLIGGMCVRLRQGDFSQRKEYGDPLEMARAFEDHGIRRLHLVDLDGAREKKMVNLGVLEQIAGHTRLIIDAGGGLRSLKDVKRTLDAGASMVTGGSIAVKDRPMFLSWVEEYGPERIILGADFKAGKIAVSGWHESTSLDLMDFVSGYRRLGVTTTICTDIEKDGMLEGPNVIIYRKLKDSDPGLKVVASGGVSRMEDIRQLDASGIDGVILGKAIYEGRIALKDIENYIINKA